MRKLTLRVIAVRFAVDEESDHIQIRNTCQPLFWESAERQSIFREMLEEMRPHFFLRSKYEILGLLQTRNSTLLV